MVLLQRSQTAIQQMLAKGLYADGTAAADDNDGGQQCIFLNLSSFPSSAIFHIILG